MFLKAVESTPVRSPLIFINFKLLQLLKHDQSTDLMLPLIFTTSKLEQYENTPYPSIDTDEGIVIVFSDSQYENALSSIIVTVFGITILVKDLQSENNPVGIIFRLDGKTMLVSDVQSVNECQSKIVLGFLKVTDLKLVHQPKAESPTYDTFGPMVTLVRLLHQENA